MYKDIHCSVVYYIKKVRNNQIVMIKQFMEQYMAHCSLYVDVEWCPKYIKWEKQSP